MPQDRPATAPLFDAATIAAQHIYGGRSHPQTIHIITHSGLECWLEVPPDWETVSELSPISARTAARAEIKPASARAQAGDVLVLAVCRVPAGHPVVHRTKLEKPMITAVQNPGDEDLLVIAAHLWD